MSDAPRQPDPAPVTVACPACGEEVLDVARRCRRCAAWLDPADPERERVQVGPGLAASCLFGLALAGLLGVAASALVGVVLPGALDRQRRAMVEDATVRLREIARAEEAWRARPGVTGFADLETLAGAGLLDPELSTGVAGGYAFTVVVSQVDAERWQATATHLDSGLNGGALDRVGPHFGINHTGAMVSGSEPIPLDPVDCALSGDPWVEPPPASR